MNIHHLLGSKTGVNMQTYSEIASQEPCHGSENRTIKTRKKRRYQKAAGALFKRKDSDAWWITINTCGSRSRFSTRTSDRATAEAMLAVAARRAAEARVQHVLSTNVADIGGMVTSSPYGWARLRWTAMNFRERQAVMFVMYDGCCAHCRKPVVIPTARNKRLPNRAVLDHRIPHVAGGSDSIDNIILSCHLCNMRKHDGSLSLPAHGGRQR